MEKLRTELADMHRWVHLPSAGALPPVLVAVRRAALRIDISAALVCRGVRIVLARNAAQAQNLMRATEIVIADTNLLADFGLRARQALRSVALIAINDNDNDADGDGSADARAIAAELGALRMLPAAGDPEDVVAVTLNAYALSSH